MIVYNPNAWRHTPPLKRPDKLTWNTSPELKYCCCRDASPLIAPQCAVVTYIWSFSGPVRIKINFIWIQKLSGTIGKLRNEREGNGRRGREGQINFTSKAASGNVQSSRKIYLEIYWPILGMANNFRASPSGSRMYETVVKLICKWGRR